MHTLPCSMPLPESGFRFCAERGTLDRQHFLQEGRPLDVYIDVELESTAFLVPRGQKSRGLTLIRNGQGPADSMAVEIPPSVIVQDARAQLFQENCSKLTRMTRGLDV